MRSPSPLHPSLAHSPTPACLYSQGGWNKSRWRGSASREEVERKYGKWVANLAKGVEGGVLSLEEHKIQARIYIYYI